MSMITNVLNYVFPAQKQENEQRTNRLLSLYEKSNAIFSKNKVYLNLAATNPQLRPLIVPLQQAIAFPNQVSQTVKLTSNLLKSDKKSLDLNVTKKIISTFKKALNLYVIVASFISLKISRKTYFAHLLLSALSPLMSLLIKMKDKTSTTKAQAIGTYNSFKALLALCLFISRKNMPKQVALAFAVSDVVLTHCKP